MQGSDEFDILRLLGKDQVTCLWGIAASGHSTSSFPRPGSSRRPFGILLRVFYPTSTCLNTISKGLSICTFTEILAPESRSRSAPWSPGADSDVVLLVDVLQELDVDPLVTSFGISEVAKILWRKHKGAALLNIIY